jgi:hypothetical protein
MNSLTLLLSLNLTKDEFIPNKKIRAIEASQTSYCHLEIESDENDQNILARIARLEGFYKNGIECSLSEN